MPAGCAGTDTQQPSLCHAHGAVGHQSLDKPDLPQVQHFVADGLVQALAFYEAPGLTRQAQLGPIGDRFRVGSIPEDSALLYAGLNFQN